LKKSVLSILSDNNFLILLIEILPEKTFSTGC